MAPPLTSLRIHTHMHREADCPRHLPPTIVMEGAPGYKTAPHSGPTLGSSCPPRYMVKSALSSKNITTHYDTYYETTTNSHICSHNLANHSQGHSPSPATLKLRHYMHRTEALADQPINEAHTARDEIAPPVLIRRMRGNIRIPPPDGRTATPHIHSIPIALTSDPLPSSYLNGNAPPRSPSVTNENVTSKSHSKPQSPERAISPPLSNISASHTNVSSDHPGPQPYTPHDYPSQHTIIAADPHITAGEAARLDAAPGDHGLPTTGTTPPINTTPPITLPNLPLTPPTIPYLPHPPTPPTLPSTQTSPTPLATKTRTTSSTSHMATKAKTRTVLWIPIPKMTAASPKPSVESELQQHPPGDDAPSAKKPRKGKSHEPLLNE